MTNRRTGRTSRLVAHAKTLAAQGAAVHIIVNSKREQARLRRLVDDTSIKVELPWELGNFDWETMRLAGAHPNCVCLVDHYAIEQRFATMFEMFHRYDLENCSPESDYWTAIVEQAR